MTCLTGASPRDALDRGEASKEVPFPVAEDARGSVAAPLEPALALTDPPNPPKPPPPPKPPEAGAGDANEGAAASEDEEPAEPTGPVGPKGPRASRLGGSGAWGAALWLICLVLRGVFFNLVSSESANPPAIALESEAPREPFSSSLPGAPAEAMLFLLAGPLSCVEAPAVSDPLAKLRPAIPPLT